MGLMAIGTMMGVLQTAMYPSPDECRPVRERSYIASSPSPMLTPTDTPFRQTTLPPSSSPLGSSSASWDHTCPSISASSTPVPPKVSLLGTFSWGAPAAPAGSLISLSSAQASSRAVNSSRSGNARPLCWASSKCFSSGSSSLSSQSSLSRCLSLYVLSHGTFSFVLFLWYFPRHLKFGALPETSSDATRKHRSSRLWRTSVALAGATVAYS